MDNTSKLFEKSKIGPMELKNRIVMGPTTTRYDLLWSTEFFKKRAKGGVGLIIYGHTKAENEIDPYPVNSGFEIMGKKTIKQFTRMTETVHRYGSKIGIELSAGSGFVADVIGDKWPASASPNPILYYPDLLTRELSVSEIKELVKKYGEAAANIEKAGFDAIFMHASNYLIDQFLQEKWNRRTDEYGGSLENRVRFFKECLQAIRDNTSGRMAVIAGIVMDPKTEGMRDIHESVEIAKEIEKTGVDALYLRNGSYANLNANTANYFREDGVSLDSSEFFNKHISIPIITDSKMVDPHVCEKAISDKKTDFVGMVRTLIADPEWPNKVMKGRKDDIRLCLSCMDCWDKYSAGKYLCCSINPDVGNEMASFKCTEASKKVLVAGGGIAGMTAALEASKRGHAVTLVEKSSQLGGNIIPAAAPDHKLRLKRFLDQVRADVLSDDSIEVVFEREVDKDFVERGKYDTAFIATGTVPFVPGIKGLEESRPANAVDVLNGTVVLEGDTVIIGGGLVGCETALYIRENQDDSNDGNVTILEVLPNIANDVTKLLRITLLEELEKMKVDLKTDVCIKRLEDKKVILETKGDQEYEMKADNIVIATGFRSNNSLYYDIKGLVDETYLIGDANRPRKIYDAMQEGYLLGKEI